MSLFNTKTMYARSVAVTRVYGKAVETLGSPIPFEGSFQPANGNDMQALPEGRRESGMFKIYSNTELNNVTTTKNPDLISLDGITYQIRFSAPWQNGIISHYKYMVRKKQSN